MAEEKFKVTQLKELLKRLNLPQVGDKATLIKRLYSHDPSGAWKDLFKGVRMDGCGRASIDDTRRIF